MNTEAEVIEMRNNLMESVMKSGRLLNKKRLKLFGKTVLFTTLIFGGAAVAVVFPSPIVIAALGGAAAIMSGRNGVINDVKKIRSKKLSRKGEKEELKFMDKEVASRSAAREVMNRIGSQQPPSAPQADPQDPQAAPPPYNEMYPSKYL